MGVVGIGIDAVVGVDVWIVVGDDSSDSVKPAI